MHYSVTVAHKLLVLESSGSNPDSAKPSVDIRLPACPYGCVDILSVLMVGQLHDRNAVSASESVVNWRGSW